MIHTAITRRVRPGREAAFEAAVTEFFLMAEASQNGIQAQLIRPLPGGDGNVYGILRSFPSEADRDAFYQSSLFAEWSRTVEPFVEGAPQRRDFHGLEAFFRQEDPPQGPAPWKMAVVTWVGVTLVTSIVIPILGPVFGEQSGLPFLAANALLNVVIVGALTWLVMPFLTRWTAAWLRA